VALNSVLVVPARATHLAGEEADVYRVGPDRLLAIGLNPVFLINKADRVVVRPALGRRYGPLLVWPRSSLKGVALGDGSRVVLVRLGRRHDPLPDRRQSADRGVPFERERSAKITYAQTHPPKTSRTTTTPQPGLQKDGECI
jgi:hypothetical protein